MNYDDVDVTIIDSKDIFGVGRSSGRMEEISPKTGATATKTKKSKPPKKHESTAAFEDDGDKKWSVGDFATKVAPTFQEKLAVLEERDRFMRWRAAKEAATAATTRSMSAKVTGTCPDMCPEKERLLREINCSFSSFEGQVVGDELLVVPELLVKEYSRSSADQDEPLPHELRPQPVLVDTMAHLLVAAVARVDDDDGGGGGGCDLAEWYHFCWDRLRSLRKDIIQQQLCSVTIVELLERSARFHMYCADRLWGVERRVFDEKINTENLVNCLQMLMGMYDELRARGVRCANETEFRVYMMLLLFDGGGGGGSGDLADLTELDRWHDERVAEAACIFFAFKLNLYTKFFKLVARTSYLNACVLQRYFGTVRSRLLNVLVSAYSSGSQTVARFSFAFARKALEFDSDDEMVAFVEKHGFSVHSNGGSDGGGEIRCSKSTFAVPETQPPCKSSSYLVRDKRPPVLEAVVGATDTFDYRPRPRVVHSSFDEFDTLKPSAIFADDQKERVISLYGDIYNSSSSSSGNSSRENERYEPLPPSPSPSPLPPISSPGGNVVETSFSFALPMSSSSSLPVRNELETRFVFHSTEPHPSVATVPSQPAPRNDEPKSGDEPPSLTFSFATTKPVLPKSPIESPKFMPPASPKVRDVELADSPLFMETDVSSPYEFEKECEYEYESSVDERDLKYSCSVAVVQQEQQPQSHPLEPLVSVRKSEEVADSLSKALNEFERLYYVRAEDTSMDEDDGGEESVMTTAARLVAKENRALRHVVRRRLKRSNAKKYARLWRKKWQSRKKRLDDEFVGVVHLSPDEYFRLWGKMRAACPPTTTTDNGGGSGGDEERLVEETLARANAVVWSAGVLNAPPLRPAYAGEKLARAIAHHAQLACCWRRCRPHHHLHHQQTPLKIPNVICRKILIALPPPPTPLSPGGHEAYRPFVRKMSELCAAFYCKGDSKLGDVTVTECSGAKVCTAVHLAATDDVDSGVLRGLTDIVLFVHERWESRCELQRRLARIYDRLTYPCFLSVVVGAVVGECDHLDDAVLQPLLNELRRKGTLIGWKATKWKNFFTLPRVIFDACRHFAPTTPPLLPLFRVKSLDAFVESVSADLFANLSVQKSSRHSPTYYIERCNEFVLRLKRAICEETDANTFNLAPEFVAAIVDSEKAATTTTTINNLFDKQSVASVLSEYALLSFTKWPPKSASKMEKLLAKYCGALDPENHTLLANVLRLVDWREQQQQHVSVAEINASAPWPRVVELWFSCNAAAVSARRRARDAFVFYDKRAIDDIVDELWVQNCD